MFNPQNDTQSEIRRGQLVQSTLACWSAAPHVRPDYDPAAGEAGLCTQARAGLWVWLLLAILIGLSAVMVIAAF